MNTLPKTPSFRLDGRRALVTGASRGIGFACAAALADAGAAVTLVARGGAHLDAGAAAIRDACGSVETLQFDIADIDVAERELTRAGPFDILVNSAGVSPHRPMLGTSAEDFDYAMSINLRAAYFVAKAVATGMVAAGRPGAIIHISSRMGHVGGADRTVYCASKHAIEGRTKAMAIELGPHRIRVSAIGPTFIRTALTDAMLTNPERRAWIESKIKLGRLRELEDIMSAVFFLAGDAAAMIAGASLLVGGVGWPVRLNSQGYGGSAYLKARACARARSACVRAKAQRRGGVINDRVARRSSDTRISKDWHEPGWGRARRLEDRWPCGGAAPHQQANCLRRRCLHR